MPILMMELTRVPDVRHPLQRGDRLLLYTDGVTERPDAKDDMFDLPRLISSLERSASLAPADQVQAIVADLDSFAGDREPDDDQTLLLIAIEPELGASEF